MMYALRSWHMYLLLCFLLLACFSTPPASPNTPHAANPTPTQYAGTPAADTTSTNGAAQSATLFTYKGHSRGVVGVAWSPDGKRIVSGGADNTVQL